MRAMNNPIWMYEACKLLGIRETPGKRATRAIIELWRTLGKRWVRSDEIHWCAVTVGACLERSGYSSTRSARARSYLDYGMPLDEPVFGCIVVFWRGSPHGKKGHVGFYLRTDRDKIWVLGGNQANSMCAKPYPASRVLGFRYPLY